MIKSILKRIIPSKIIMFRSDYLIRKHNREAYLYDIKMFEMHSGLHGLKSETNHEAKLILLYHVIEKGLTMPEMKDAFGKPRVKQLIDECFIFRNKFNSTNYHFMHSLSVLNEYFFVNDDSKDGDLNILKELYTSLITNISVDEIHQIKETRYNYFQSAKKDFFDFANGRKSIRNFTKGINEENLLNAIKLAQTAPSTCNRQPSRVHIVKDENLQKKVLDIQKGNRGFGHLVDLTLVLTADLSIYATSEERFSPFVDGGIFTMNLLYALHYYKIAACPLNWCKSPQEDLNLRNVISIPDNETVIVVIACGNLPEEFMIANSPRTPTSLITKFH
jgi:nitroreductase